MKNVEDIYPLSPMQKLMLMYSQTTSGSSALVNQFRYRIQGAIDETQIQLAWQQILNRHAALRTCFVWEGLREPMQVVRQTTALDFEYTDLSELVDSEQAKSLLDIQLQDSNHVFDLHKAPLFRVTLIRLAETEFRMFFTRHHLILDGWSIDRLFNELLIFYTSINAIETLPSVCSFKHYIQWLKKQDRTNAKLYWQKELKNLESPSLLTSQKAQNDSAEVKELSTIETILDTVDYSRCKALAQSYQISEASLLQGAVGLVLARHFKRHDITFGLTVSGRPLDLDGIEFTVGSFINNVPVCLHIDTQLPLSEWLRAIHNKQASRLPFEYVSPSELLEWSELPVSVPMYDILLLLNSATANVYESKNINIELLEGKLESALPFLLSIGKNRQQLELKAIFDPAYIDDKIVRALLDDLIYLLKIISAEPLIKLDAFVSAPSVPIPSKSLEKEMITVIYDEQQSAKTNTLRKIWCTTLGLNQIGLDEDFFTLGGTSLQASQLLIQIEKQLNQVLPLSTLFTARTIREFLAVIDEPIYSSSSLVTIQPEGDKPSYYLIPGIGGNVVGFAELAKALGTNQPLFGFQSVGLDGKEDPLSSIEEIAARYVSDLNNANQHLVLLGICWGAAVALEMAQQLTLAGKPVPLLVVMDPVYRENLDTKPATKSLLQSRIKFISNRVRLYSRNIRQLKGKELRNWFRDKITLLVSIIRNRNLFQGASIEINQLRVTETNLNALMRYCPKPYRGKTVVLFTDDRDIEDANDTRRRWLTLVPEETAVVIIPGNDTGDALSQNNVTVLASILHEQADVELSNKKSLVK